MVPGAKSPSGCCLPAGRGTRDAGRGTRDAGQGTMVGWGRHICSVDLKPSTADQRRLTSAINAAERQTDEDSWDVCPPASSLPKDTETDRDKVVASFTAAPHHSERLPPLFSSLLLQDVEKTRKTRKTRRTRRTTSSSSRSILTVEAKSHLVPF